MTDREIMQQALDALEDTELLAELMNPNIPKNDREHAAVREIERLRETRQAAIAQRKPLTESMISAGLNELEAIRQTEFVGDYELIKRLLEAAHAIKEQP